MPNYTNSVNKTSLDASPFTIPNFITGGVDTFTGSEPAASVTEVPNKPFSLDDYLVIGSENVAKKKADIAASGKIDPGSFASLKPIAYGALFVVVGLLVLSRGFGMLGEEGENVIVSLGNPAKFPGIGHAVSKFKRK